MNIKIIIKAFVISGLLMFTGLGVSAQTDHAALALAVTGDVSIRNVDGELRQAKRRSKIYPGESVITKSEASIKMRFTDGGIISMVADSEFRIDTYHFEDKAQGENKVVMTLLKGGLRSITGLIGGKDKKAYKMKTAVSVIGIRGTDYHLLLCQGGCSHPHMENTPVDDGLYAKVNKTDEHTRGIVMKNDAGEANVGEGQTSYVKDFDSIPVLNTFFPDRATAMIRPNIETRPVMPPPQVPTAPMVYSPPTYTPPPPPPQYPTYFY